MSYVTKKIIHRFIRSISDYEFGGEVYGQVIPEDTQAYAVYNSATKYGLFFVIGDGQHTYVELREGLGTKQYCKEYKAFIDDIAWGEIKGTLSNQTDLQAALNAKVAIADIINNTSSTATDKPLSANMGKELQDQVNNLKSIGRFLSLWNSSSGLPTTTPTVLPYTYKTGDYFVVSIVASGSNKNYKPDGTTYTGVASTVEETEKVNPNDIYFFDGSVWKLLINSKKDISFAEITGNPYDNTNLAQALDEKVTKNSDIDSATHTKITYDSKGLVTGGSELEEGDLPRFHWEKILDTLVNINDVNQLQGITSNVQTQLNNKVEKNNAITAGTHTKITYDSKGLVTAGTSLAEADIPALHLSKVTDVTATAAEVNVLDGIETTTQELNYVHGVTSNIQTQLNSKASDNNVVKLTGDQTVAGKKTFTDILTVNNELHINTNTSDSTYLNIKDTNVDGQIALINTLASDNSQKGKVVFDYNTGTNKSKVTLDFDSTQVPTPTEDTTSSTQIDTVGARNTKLDNYVLANEAITAGTHTKITYDSKGLVTGGTNLVENDIPALHLTKITDVTATATEVNYLDGVTSNVQTQLDNKVEKNNVITGATHTKITYDSKGLVTNGSDLTANDIPDISATYYLTSNPSGYVSASYNSSTEEITFA